MSGDYRATVFLPRTDFPMKASLAQREPELLARWEKLDLYARLRAQAKGREKFILHDGPPYANGHIHIGHALNKILKDVINRSQQMMGKDGVFVPGWDCHGLPIEWQVEQRYRSEGKDKDTVPAVRFRQECRAFAQRWIEVQREEFQRLGVLGDWKHSYTTMSYEAEAQIVRELGRFLLNGGLYRGAKPVMWSVVEKTALAEAEVEYHDRVSPTVWMKFPVVKFSRQSEARSLSGLVKIWRGLNRQQGHQITEDEEEAFRARATIQGASVVIWTTTPWTIPGNRAIAYLDLETDQTQYALYEVVVAPKESGAKEGEKLVLAACLAGQVMEATYGTQLNKVRDVSWDELSEIVCHHPLHGRGYDFEVPLLPSGHVTLEQGTGLVHIAPGHGAEDFELGRAFGLEVPETVGEDGSFYEHVPLFAGTRVLTPDGRAGDADVAVCRALAEAGALLATGKLTHAYPHSWRSKAPLIFRNTTQWFISMEANGLREKALAAIDRVRWVPPASKARIYGMVQIRPDWVVSRQRVWGVPLTVFVERASGEPLRDPEVLERVAKAVEAEGAEAWFVSDAKRFLGDAYDADDYQKVTDILDVWFDSGSTHSFVLEKRPELGSPASLYVEGSDQHRGWFQSSLLESCGTRSRAPYEAVLTHGFVVDGEGRKMSKSLGNVIAPQEVLAQYGADILRLWVVSADYSEDLRISHDILRHQVDAYRRLRNTLRYLLGNLSGFSDSERLAYGEMPELEHWVLHRLAELDERVRQACADFDFHRLFVALHNFCAVDLSAFYFDVRKDSLYCDRADLPRRRAARTVLDAVFSRLAAWLAPILCFTAEEAWLARDPGEEESVHLSQFPPVPDEWRDAALAKRWRQVRALRRVVTGALEVERRERRIGSSLEAHPTVFASPEHVAAVDGLDLAEITITSDATLIEGPVPEGAFVLEDVAGVGTVAGLAHGGKCRRCWRILPEVGRDSRYPDVCSRCADAVAVRESVHG